MIKSIWKKFIEVQYGYLFSKPQTEEEKLKEYYYTKYPTRPIFYAGRYLYNSKTKISIDVKNFITPNDEQIKMIIQSLNLDGLDDDDKAVECLRWVLSNIKYTTDASQDGVQEFWSFPFETIATKLGDCEDFSILIASLLIASGIPSWKIRITAGNVILPGTTKVVGHAFVTYYSIKENKWVLLDGTYYPNLNPIKERIAYNKEANYKDIWFSFNDQGSWSSDEDIREVEKL